jgi:hypothetical protein
MNSNTNSRNVEVILCVLLTLEFYGFEWLAAFAYAKEALAFVG